jgi:hypothetical protein
VVQQEATDDPGSAAIEPTASGMPSVAANTSSPRPVMSPILVARSQAAPETELGDVEGSPGSSWRRYRDTSVVRTIQAIASGGQKDSNRRPPDPMIV